jgi:hypothetical protein
MEVGRHNQEIYFISLKVGVCYSIAVPIAIVDIMTHERSDSLFVVFSVYVPHLRVYLYPSRRLLVSI